ncbi:flagellar assembly protein FliW [Thermomicrobium sp. CFH 73360]|uniref:flagellar assembly protein FliW n=1 Tax=Thermomicrobium sp. CFH 73360 TaxID=2951987 RepID=UPI00207753F4|nr:flagellar assembly protein FliW [Thermomicrobium sp. CFH 73360]MCM8746321.1 flagellar assembly protein FliW [Thermomicrobium sp. CFH 73360]
MTQPMSEPQTVSNLTAIHTEIIFPNGLVGCPEWRRFMVEAPEDLPGLLLLRSLDEPGIEFVLAPVLELVPDFFEQLAASDRAALVALGVGRSEQVELWATLSVHEDGLVTANLLGPLVLDFERGCGTQVVLTESGWGTRHPILTR